MCHALGHKDARREGRWCRCLIISSFQAHILVKGHIFFKGSGRSPSNYFMSLKCLMKEVVTLTVCAPFTHCCLNISLVSQKEPLLTKFGHNQCFFTFYLFELACQDDPRSTLEGWSIKLYKELRRPTVTPAWRVDLGIMWTGSCSPLNLQSLDFVLVEAQNFQTRFFVRICWIQQRARLRLYSRGYRAGSWINCASYRGDWMSVDKVVRFTY